MAHANKGHFSFFSTEIRFSKLHLGITDILAYNGEQGNEIKINFVCILPNYFLTWRVVKLIVCHEHQ